MQNEERINGLETQVRTLKRIVCLVCCLFVFAMIGGCQSLPTMELPPLVEGVASIFADGPHDETEKTEMSDEWDRNPRD